MKVEFSPDANILSLWFADKPVDHAEEAGPFIVHVDGDGAPVLIEILDAVQFLETSMTRVVASLLQELEATPPGRETQRQLAEAVQGTFGSYQALVQKTLEMVRASQAARR